MVQKIRDFSQKPIYCFIVGDRAFCLGDICNQKNPIDAIQTSVKIR
jgi:hypothetical protein